MNLQDRLDEQCITIAELARRTKVSRPTIYKALQGYDVRRNTWGKLAKYFNCSIKDIRG